jgi:hypothetical protein
VNPNYEDRICRAAFWSSASDELRAYDTLLALPGVHCRAANAGGFLAVHRCTSHRSGIDSTARITSQLESCGGSMAHGGHRVCGRLLCPPVQNLARSEPFGSLELACSTVFVQLAIAQTYAGNQLPNKTSIGSPGRGTTQFSVIPNKGSVTVAEGFHDCSSAS